MVGAVVRPAGAARPALADMRRFTTGRRAEAVAMVTVAGRPVAMVTVAGRPVATVTVAGRAG
jgi:hypothetical protein